MERGRIWLQGKETQAGMETDVGGLSLQDKEKWGALEPVQMFYLGQTHPVQNTGRGEHDVLGTLQHCSEVPAWKRNKERWLWAQEDPSVFEEYLFIYQLMHLFYLVLLRHLENKES